MNWGQSEQVIPILQVKTPPDILKNEANQDQINIQVQKESHIDILNLTQWTPKMAKGHEQDPDPDQGAMVKTSK